MYDAEWGVQAFLGDLYEYVAVNVNLKAYHGMTEEKREALKTKMTILACKEFAPKRNFNISRDEVRRLVGEIIELEYRGSQDEPH
jgi:hypothetical protein